MSVIIYRNNIEYVSTLLEIEERKPAKLYSALSFISSLYFPDNTIGKFYKKIDNSKAIIADILCKRNSIRKSQNNKLERKEIYEASAFTGIIKQGIVHDQDSSFRITPNEIISTLKEIVAQLEMYSNFEIAVTQEILPFIYLLSPPETVLIDVRTNYEYQQLQGICIEEKISFDRFWDDFNRVWFSKNTLNSKKHIIELIRGSIEDWEQGRSINLDAWPAMIMTDRQ